MRRSSVTLAAILVASSCFRSLPASAEPAEQAAPKPAPAASARCPFLEAAADGGVAQRAFDFTGEKTGPLRGYHLRYAPYAALSASYRPWAHAGCGWPSRFGIRLGYERILAVHTTLADQSLDTNAFAVRGELELEFPLGKFALTPRAGFLHRRFDVEKDYVPDPAYDLVTAGVEGGFRHGMFLAELAWTAHFVLDAGSLQSDDWFPHATGFGFQAQARAGISPIAWFDVFALAEYESYAFDLHSSEPAAYPAGVAVDSYDRYLRLGLGVRFYVPPGYVSPRGGAR